jgi:hypothetical protein
MSPLSMRAQNRRAVAAAQIERNFSAPSVEQNCFTSI